MRYILRLLLCFVFIQTNAASAQSSDFVRGINVFFTAVDYEEVGFTQRIDLLVGRLENANIDSVGLTWLVYTDGCRGDAVFAGEKTPSNEALRHFASVATNRGMNVWLHPILDEQSVVLCGRNHWRGTIRPRDVPVWFENYTQLLVSYADFSEEVGVAGIVLATELTSMERYGGHWAQLISEVRGVFSGQLTYASNRGISDTFPWDLVDVIGVDAFFDLNVSRYATADEMGAAFSRTKEYGDLSAFLAQADAIGKPLMFLEVGTSSQEGSFRKSRIWDHRTPVDLESQRRYYQAVCEVWKPHLAGMFWWTTIIGAIADPSVDSDYNPMGKPAENEIALCYQ